MRTFKSITTGNEYQSFLEVLSEESFTPDDINRKAILDFITFGALNFEDTFIKKIQKKFTHQPNQLDVVNGLIDSTYNSRNPLEDSNIENSVNDFISFFEKRANHLKSKNISLDLTGGIDSRLVAVVLHYLDVPFDTAFSINSGDEKELQIARQVAQQLGVRFTVMSSDGIEDESELNTLFEYADGLWDVLKLKALIENQKWRKSEGYDLVITGVGGELYKDFWWQQDFPLYRKVKSNLPRLIKTRMYAANIQDEWLSNSLKPVYSTYQDELIKQLMQFEIEINTKTYDQIYFHFRIKEQVSLLSNITQNFIDTYSPLLEPELLKIGYNLPRAKRFFNRFHRTLITKLNPEVAKIPTTEGGMSVSNYYSYLFRDIGLFSKVKSRKAYNKFFRSGTYSSKVKCEKVPEVIVEELERNLTILKEMDILHHSVDMKTLPAALYGRFITLGKFLSLLQNK